jgi:hypothetical protein
MRGLLIVAVLLVGLLYGSHIWRGGFVFQDSRIVTAPSASILQGRGLAQSSWLMVNTPRASHALNLSLHLLVVSLSGLLLWQIGVSPWLAMSLLVLHPLTIETVAYAGPGRAEMIAAVGVLGGLCLALSAGWVLSPLLFLVGYLGKESAFVGVALVPLVLWAAGRPRVARWAAVGLGSAALVAVVWTWPALAAWSHIGEVPPVFTVAPGAWLAVQALATWRLLVLSVAPIWLTPGPNIQHVSVIAVVPLIFFAGLVEIAWRCRARAPMVTMGIVWCALVALPRFFVRTPLSPFNEHQWYLALPGVACVISGLIESRRLA